MRNIFKQKPVVNPEFSVAMEKLGARTSNIRAIGLWQKDVQAQQELVAAASNVTELPRKWVDADEPLPEPQDFEKYVELAEVLGAVRSTVRIIPVAEKPYDYEADAEIS